MFFLGMNDNWEIIFEEKTFFAEQTSFFKSSDILLYLSIFSSLGWNTFVKKSEGEIKLSLSIFWWFTLSYISDIKLFNF